MDDIEQYFEALLSEHHSVDIADSDFKMRIAEDPELKARYRDWCHQVGSTERLGFRDWCAEFLESQDSVWDSLTDYDDQQ